MCLFTSSVTVTVKFNLYIMDLMIKINREQYDKVTDAVDFRGRRPIKDGMPLKMLIYKQFIIAKQGFHSSTSRYARAEAVSRQKDISLVQVVLSLKRFVFCC